MFLAEGLKVRRSSLPWLAVLAPVLLVALVTLVNRGHPERVTDDAVQVWDLLALPLGAALLGTVAAQWESGGVWQHQLTRPVPPRHLYLTKLAWLWLLAVLGTLVFGAGLVLGGHRAPLEFVLSAGWCALPLLALHLWVALRAGPGPSLGLGVAGLILATLLGGTGLGTHVWPLVPWAWAPYLRTLDAWWGVLPLATGTLAAVLSARAAERAGETLAQPGA